MSRSLPAALALCIGAAACAHALPVSVAHAAPPQALSVAFGGAPASARFRGVSAVRHGFDWMPEDTDKGLTPALRNVSLARLATSRLAGARTWYEASWAMPGGWGTPLNFTSPRFEAFAAWVSAMHDRDVSVVLNTGWFLPFGACEAGAPGGSPAQNCSVTAASTAVWTQWISETVRELVLRRGLDNVDTLLLFTEPFPNKWPANFQPGLTPEQGYAALVRALDAQMRADGTRALVAFHGPNDGALSSAVGQETLRWAVSELGDVLDIVTSHDYGLHGYAAWLALFSNATAITRGRDFWVDEGGAGSGFGGEAVRNASSYGTYVAAWQAALMNAGAANSFLWLLQDQYYAGPCATLTNNDSFVNGLQRWGLSFWLPDQIAPRPAFYAFDIMSRFLRPPAGASGRYIASFAMAGAQPGSGVVGAAVAGSAALGRPDYAAVLLVNEGNASAAVTVALQGAPAASFGPLQRFLYDPAAPPTAPITASGSNAGGGASIVDVLPSGGVVVWAVDWQQAAEVVAGAGSASAGAAQAQD